MEASLGSPAFLEVEAMAASWPWQVGRWQSLHGVREGRQEDRSLVLGYWECSANRRNMQGQTFRKQLETEAGTGGHPFESVWALPRRVSSQRGHSSQGRADMSREGTERWMVSACPRSLSNLAGLADPPHGAVPLTLVYSGRPPHLVTALSLCRL